MFEASLDDWSPGLVVVSSFPRGDGSFELFDRVIQKRDDNLCLTGFEAPCLDPWSLPSPSRVNVGDWDKLAKPREMFIRRAPRPSLWSAAESVQAGEVGFRKRLRFAVLGALLHHVQELADLFLLLFAECCSALGGRTPCAGRPRHPTLFCRR